MCQCGDFFCNLPRNENAWANKRYTRLFSSKKWKETYPDELARELILNSMVIASLDRIRERLAGRSVERI